MSKVAKRGKRLNDFEFCRLRPDTFIGNIQTVQKECWVYIDALDDEEEDDEETGGKNKKDGVIVSKVIPYNSGLVRISVEIGSNIVDNKWNSDQEKVPMKKIEIDADTDPDSETYGYITMTNDGMWIPVEKMTYTYTDPRSGKETEEEMYPAETYFGDFKSGTNYDVEDDEGHVIKGAARKTSGRNGIGAKATNVMSKVFIVEHADPKAKKVFYQKYENNGRSRSVPKITSYRGSTGYTKISFLPDYARFAYPTEDSPGIDSNYVDLLKRYAVEWSLFTGVPVIFNGDKIVVKSLMKYVRMFYPDAKEHPAIEFKTEYGDECVLVEGDLPLVNQMDSVKHMSFVNGIYTRDGGTHVNVWKDAIFKPLVTTFNKRKPKKGDAPLKASATQMYPYFVLFVRCEVDGQEAAFDSQSKDELTAPIPNLFDPESAASKKAFNDEIKAAVTKMMKWGFTELLIEKLSMSADAIKMKKVKATGKLALGKKLLEANDVCPGSNCEMFFTEGLSAKNLADSMIDTLGHDKYGSYALKGKFINVQTKSRRQVMKNDEVKEIIDILGLAHPGMGVDYSINENFEKLRYCKIILLTDADDDGIHINGLLQNFFYTFWPGLYQRGYVTSFSTAVTVVTTGKGVSAQKTIFYSNPEFRTFQETGALSKMRGAQVKYYKGLGSHRPGEEAMYFEDPKCISYFLDGKEVTYMDLGFGKDAKPRQKWIVNGLTAPGTLALDVDPVEAQQVEGDMALSSFVDSVLIIYHRMALQRAIPNIYDGFKLSQRMAYYGISTHPKAKKTSVGLENLVGAIKEKTGYHHGQKSLEDTVKKMAAGFVGTNNIPLFDNDGQYGTRTTGMEGASSSRYLFTKLEDIAKYIFREEDEPILELVYDESHDKEKPVGVVNFEPIIPMVLVNGALGIACGFATNIPGYNPEDLIAWQRVWLDATPEEDGKRIVERESLVPWYRGFTGRIELVTPEPDEDEDGNVTTYPATAWKNYGVLEQMTTRKGWWAITEIPVGITLNAVHEYLGYLSSGNPPKGSKKKKGEKYIKDFAKYGTVNIPRWEILPVKTFIPDIDIAGNFKILQESNSLKNMVVIDENSYPRRYASPEELLQDFCIHRLEIYSKRKDYWLDTWAVDLAKESARYQFIRRVVNHLERKTPSINPHQKDGGLVEIFEAEGWPRVDGKYDYLLDMPVRSMTVERLEKLKISLENIQAKIDTLQPKTPEDLWKADLDEFMEAYVRFLKTRKEEREGHGKKTGGKKVVSKTGVKPTTKATGTTKTVTKKASVCTTKKAIPKKIAAKKVIAAKMATKKVTTKK